MSTVTKEWLQQTIEEMEYDKATFPGDLSEDHGNVLEAFKLALAGMEAEPVAMRWRYLADGIYEAGEWNYRNQNHIDELNSHSISRQCELLYTAPQPLTTSERAELENYRNAQQVVPGDIDARMKSAGMLSAAEIIAGQPIDAFVKHAGVVDMGSLVQWAEMRRAEFLRMQARYELGDKEKDDLYEWVVSHVAVFSELHVNIRAAMLQGAESVESRCTIKTAPALDSSPKIAESRCSNSPVIPDGWVMVPVEPTAEMISSGVAAHYDRNKIQIHDRPAPGPIECAYVAMIAAAPQQEAVSSALGHGIARYYVAMQKLADGGD